MNDSYRFTAFSGDASVLPSRRVWPASHGTQHVVSGVTGEMCVQQWSIRGAVPRWSYVQEHTMELGE